MPGQPRPCQQLASGDPVCRHHFETLQTDLLLNLGILLVHMSPPLLNFGFCDTVLCCPIPLYDIAFNFSY